MKVNVNGKVKVKVKDFAAPSPCIRSTLGSQKKSRIFYVHGGSGKGSKKKRENMWVGVQETRRPCGLG